VNTHNYRIFCPLSHGIHIAIRVVMRHRNPVLNAAPRVHFPLARLALCLDCDACFEIGLEQCPACGSRTWSSLSRFIALQGQDLEPALLPTRSTEISHEPLSSVA
jgi:hypothetical protein